MFRPALVLAAVSCLAVPASASTYTEAQAKAFDEAAAHEVSDHDRAGESIFRDLADRARAGHEITLADLPDSMRDDVRTGRRDTQESEDSVHLRHVEERLAILTQATIDANAALVAHATVDTFRARRELSEPVTFHTCAREVLAHADADLDAVMPDGDRDHDGIPDSRDRCPDEPEDRDGFQDEDGCPDPDPVETDRDHDGIPDKRDRCPDVPETVNGIADDDGCPDEMKAVHFASDSARLDGDAIETIAANAEILRAVPSLGVSLVGHCDSQNSDAYNYRLGHQRADAVKDYMTKFLDVAPERLSTESAGEDQPVADNSTEEGRRANRRVEFTVRR